VGARIDVDRAIKAVEKEFGPVWVLVNNAYSSEKTPVEDITDDALDEALRTCVHGSLYTMQACFPSMKERGGRIINFGSGAAAVGMPELGAYNIAKEGVRGLTKTAAQGWGKYGITVNTVCPQSNSGIGWQKWFDRLGEEGQRRHLESIPLRRPGDAEKDIGAVVVFLAGPGGAYITSRTLHVDGGAGYYDR
jgi:NAD(P)-dependent dehydrogenase (short-subunit alcohol dehydrogenase family)